MISKQLYDEVKAKALALYEKAHIILTESEKTNLEIADFGLNDVYNTGLEIVTYVNTDLCCAKEMVLLPHQTCPEHVHAPFGDYHGKEETFRCRYGKVFLYVEGEPAADPQAKHPEGAYTVFQEVVLNPGEQYTMMPNTLHWFQAGDEGAVISEFSTKSYDEYDIFTDKNIKRIPEISE